MLERVSALLRPRFDVVSIATNGKLVVEEAIRLEPDAVVSDIAMPGLDGIRAAEELKRRGSTARVVFLSLHQEEDYIVAGLGSGACAYVFKSRMALDLERALDTVLKGRMFVSPSPAATAAAPPLWWKHGACRHIVQHYSNDGLQLDEISQFFCSVLKEGDKVLVIATKAHLAGLAQRLEAGGIDLPHATKAGLYRELDAVAAIASFTRDGKLDTATSASSLRAMMSADVSGQNGGSRMVAYGEMAPLLWAEGHADLALQLEQVTTDIVTDSIYVVCDYPTALPRTPGATESLKAIDDEHCAVYRA